LKPLSLPPVHISNVSKEHWRIKPFIFQALNHGRRLKLVGLDRSIYNQKLILDIFKESPKILWHFPSSLA